jgi:hypothetical protein
LYCAILWARRGCWKDKEFSRFSIGFTLDTDTYRSGHKIVPKSSKNLSELPTCFSLTAFGFVRIICVSDIAVFI